MKAQQIFDLWVQQKNGAPLHIDDFANVFGPQAFEFW